MSANLACWSPRLLLAPAATLLEFTKSEVLTKFEVTIYSFEHKKWSAGSGQAEGNLQLDQITQPHITAHSHILATVLMYSCHVCIWHCLRQEQCKITILCQLTAMLECNTYQEMSKGDLSIIAAGLRAEELLLQALHYMQQLPHCCRVWTALSCNQQLYPTKNLCC